MGRLAELVVRARARDEVALMGVLNRTPDSFSDGGAYLDDAHAIERAEAMLAEGAGTIDVGAESTRPGAPSVPDAEQIARLGGVVEVLASRGVVVSIDTTSPRVAAWALERGAAAINTVDPARTPELARLCARRGADLVIMHSRGAMASMPGFSQGEDAAYRDVVSEVVGALAGAAAEAREAGLAADEVLLDPGLGFHKNARQSLALVARLAELAALGYPVLAGPSRKSFVAAVATREGAAPAPPGERLGGTIAACLACARAGARVLRVHDVAAVAQALRFDAALRALEARPASAQPTAVQRA